MTTLTNVVLLPMIKILFVLKIINHISKEEHFSRLCKTLEGVIKFLLKGFLSVLLGVQLIQSMILPAVDSMKNTVLQKGMSAIPGIGSGLNSAMTMVIGSAVVIKNSIGAVGILVLIVIIVPPVIEITAVVLTYLLAGIMIQPISDKKDHRSDGCSHSKREINAFDDLYNGTIIYPVRGIDRILNQR